MSNEKKVDERIMKYGYSERALEQNARDKARQIREAMATKGLSPSGQPVSVDSPLPPECMLFIFSSDREKMDWVNFWSMDYLVIKSGQLSDGRPYVIVSFKDSKIGQLIKPKADRLGSDKRPPDGTLALPVEDEGDDEFPRGDDNPF